MKMYKDEKTQGLQRVILIVEIFTNIRCLGFLTFIKEFNLLKEMFSLITYTP